MTPHKWFERPRAKVCAALLGMLGASSWACDVPAGVDAASVVPIIWNRAASEANFPKVPRVIPTQDLNEELTVAFVENTPTRLSYFQIPADQAACWKERATLGRFQRNLAREIRQIGTNESPEGVVMVTAGGNFESSLILAPRVLQQAFEKPLDVLAVAIPARDLLFIADPSQPKALAQLRQKASEAFRDSRYAISGKVFLVSACDITVLQAEQPTTGQTQPCRP